MRNDRLLRAPESPLSTGGASFLFLAFWMACAVGGSSASLPTSASYSASKQAIVLQRIGQRGIVRVSVGAVVCGAWPPCGVCYCRQACRGGLLLGDLPLRARAASLLVESPLRQYRAVEVLRE